MVMDETRRTIRVHAGSKDIIMAKDTIKFTIEDEEIDGSAVGQRPEDRIGKTYRRS
jgi:RNase P/RNase MRP subunit p29